MVHQKTNLLAELLERSPWEPISAVPSSVFSPVADEVIPNSRQRDDPDRYPGLPKEALDVNPLPPQTDQSGLDHSCQLSVLPFPFPFSPLPLSPFPFSSLGKGGGALPLLVGSGKTAGGG